MKGVYQHCGEKHLHRYLAEFDFRCCNREVKEAPMTDDKSQSDKFKEAARELGCDEDEGSWDERLRKVAKQELPDKPVRR